MARELGGAVRVEGDHLDLEHLLRVLRRTQPAQQRLRTLDERAGEGVAVNRSVHTFPPRVLEVEVRPAWPVCIDDLVIVAPRRRRRVAGEGGAHRGVVALRARLWLAWNILCPQPPPPAALSLVVALAELLGGVLLCEAVDCAAVGAFAQRVASPRYSSSARTRRWAGGRLRPQRRKPERRPGIVRHGGRQHASAARAAAPCQRGGRRAAATARPTEGSQPRPPVPPRPSATATTYALPLAAAAGPVRAAAAPTSRQARPTRWAAARAAAPSAPAQAA
mmetsp:Transcript_16470/g.49755  ORF Transcript_16470/g.49755 Transcript_16470/m.49755 type:complete len:278 (-) Transcript_16470:763-1596(-)